MNFVLFCQKTAFFKLDDVFKECSFYLEKAPHAEPLVCLQHDCHVGHSCMSTLAKRIHVLFQEIVTRSNLIVLYYKKRNVSGIGAALFWEDMREPRIITINPSAWRMIKRRGMIYQFDPAPDFYLTGGSAAPPEEILLESPHVTLD